MVTLPRTAESYLSPVFRRVRLWRLLDGRWPFTLWQELLVVYSGKHKEGRHTVIQVANGAVDDSPVLSSRVALPELHHPIL